LRHDPSLEALHAQIEKIEGRSRRVKSVLPFGIAELDSRLPGGGLAHGALHEVAGGGNDAVNSAAGALFTAGIAARTRGKVLWCIARSDLFAPALSQAGLKPDRVIYLEASDEKTILASFEECLRHCGLGAAIAEVEALEKVRNGEIAATALIAGKPVRSVSKLTRADRLHFVPVPYPTQLIGDYLPATLSYDDYPDFMAPGETVDTVAVGAVLIAYNWPKTNSDRYRRVQRFVEAFFPKIAEFQKPSRHQKWREINLAATLPGWTRFEAAQAWLDDHRQEQQRTEPMIAGARPGAAAGGARSASSGAEQPRVTTDPLLYQEFLKWRQQRGQ
jgi:hypothetical protein